MSDFNVRSDAVDVEQIMRQIRARIREKRGADYTEAELQQLASVKLERFLDPRGLRSDLVEQFRRQRTVSPEPPKYEFEDTTLYDTHRGLLRAIRKLLNPILKLFVNPNPLIHALHTQKQVNDEFHRRFRQREEMDPLYYEVVHNLVLETTRLGIEVHNLKMRVESMSSRLDFDERRARSLEGVVQYRQPPRQRHGGSTPSGPASPVAARSAGPQTPATSPSSSSSSASSAPSATTSDVTATPVGEPAEAPISAAGAPVAAGAGPVGQGPGGERRRRRRRRRRRPGQTMAERQGQTWGAGAGEAGAGEGSGGADAGDDFAGDDAGGDAGDGADDQ
jgi:hypothetical protein